MLRQLQLAMTDQELHKKDPLAKDFDPFEIHRNISLKTSLLPPRQENRFLCAFSHIFAGGYAAGYYSYKWAEVLSADAFSAFKELLDKNASREEFSKLGKKYRQTILGLGGSEEPGKVFKEFRGRDFKIEPLLEDYGII